MTEREPSMLGDETLPTKKNYEDMRITLLLSMMVLTKSGGSGLLRVRTKN